MNYKNHIIQSDARIEDALSILNALGEDLTLFVIDSNCKLIGTITDGDIRRGFLNGISLSSSVSECMNPTFRYLKNGNFSFKEIDILKAQGVKLVPILDEVGTIFNVLNFTKVKTILPIDVVIMAGGEGQRLRPLTESLPKPLLKVGEKPIIEHMIDRLVEFGINNIHISLNYLGDKIIDYLGDGSSKGVSIKYIFENQKLGTAGALGLVPEFQNQTLLLLNSDILTNIDFEDLYKNFLELDSDLMAASIPYNVKIPYAVFDTIERNILSLKEKPTYTYYSNGGIYMMKKSVHSLIPKNELYNATELMDDLITLGKKVNSYPVVDYWLDIGKMDDYIKAQQDIKYLKF